VPEALQGAERLSVGAFVQWGVGVEFEELSAGVRAWGSVRNLTWLAPSAALCALSLAVLATSGREPGRGAAAGWFLLSAAGPAVLAFALRQVSKLRVEIGKISTPSLGVELPPVGLIGSGLALLFVALSASDAATALPFAGWARSAAVVIVSAFFLSYGAVLYVYAKAAGLAVRLGRSPVRSETLAWPGTAIRTAHGVYVSLLVVGTVLYLLGVLVVWFSPGGRWLTMNAAWMRLWVLPPGVAVLAFFATFSVALHRVLVQCRERAETELGEQLQELDAIWK